jgi:hypothetical protein
MLKYAVVTLVLGAVATWAAVIVEEDFEGSRFPPTGWETIQNNGLWTREHVGGSYQRVAYFYSYGLVGGSGLLRTAGHNLDSDRYRVSFVYSYREQREGSGGTTATYARVQWKDGNVWRLVAGQSLPLNTSLRSYSFEYDGVRQATYRLFFRAFAAPNTKVLFRVDNVKWESGPFTGVGPASLGRVKALFQ